MELNYTWWIDGKFYMGYLDMWPEGLTEGYSLKELEEALAETYDFYLEFEAPRLKKLGKLWEKHKGTLVLNVPESKSKNVPELAEVVV